MRLLIDTQLLLWALAGSQRLSDRAALLLDDPVHEVLFSPLSIAEVAIKRAKGVGGFDWDAAVVRAGLIASDYGELPLTSLHAQRLTDLPPIHKDPFDRLLIAQALDEGIALVTADALLGRYPGRVVVV